MEEKILSVKPLSQSLFGKFGVVLEKPSGEPSVELEILRYWDSIGMLRRLEGDYSIGFLEVYRRPMRVEFLERHLKTWEVLIPLKGTSIIPVAPPSGSEVPIDEVEAFILDGSSGILMYEGTWHYAPYPVTSKATFLVVFKKDTPTADLELKELKTYNVRYRITL